MQSNNNPHYEKIDLSTDQHEFQLTLTSRFLLKLIEKLSNLDAINNSIKKFNLIHSNNEPVDLSFCNQPGFDFFDENGKWNVGAYKVDENKGSGEDHFYLMKRLDEILYPNILEEGVTISDKEKTILCAIVHDIQSRFLSQYLPDMNKDFSEAALKHADQIKFMIYKAAHDAVASIFPELGKLIAHAEYEAAIATATAKSHNNTNSNSFMAHLVNWGFAQSPVTVKGTEREPLVASIQEGNKKDDCKCSIF